MGRGIGEGLYTSKYSSVDNRTLFAAITHMQPTYARQMVPCFDEPENKATWDLQIIHPKETEAVSNQKEIGTEE